MKQVVKDMRAVNETLMVIIHSIWQILDDYLMIANHQFSVAKGGSILLKREGTERGKIVDLKQGVWGHSPPEIKLWGILF